MQLANLAVLEIEPSVRMPWLKWRETNNEIGRYLLPMTICNLTPTCTVGSHAKTSQKKNHVVGNILCFQMIADGYAHGAHTGDL